MFIQPAVLFGLLEGSEPSMATLTSILNKSHRLERLNLTEVASLIRVNSSEGISMILEMAGWVKEQIYGKRIVIFAPMYVSNICKNNCAYCGFRSDNKMVHRKTLSMDEIKAETLILLKTGQKRVLLVTGETKPDDDLQLMMESIKTVYDVSDGKNKIRRINVNMAPLAIDGFKELLSAGIGTYQLFQETYHPETYARLHTQGSKSDYIYRLEAMDRAYQAGFQDIGMGVLFGLYDYRFEVLALMQHIEHLEVTYGLGPHTLSVPRLEPAMGSVLSEHPDWPVDDQTFEKIVAILRLAVPYTGIILSTRESAPMRQRALELGVSQISASSRTNPGGYSQSDTTEQFSLGDDRSLDDVVLDCATRGYIPSFCTGCYRTGRTGLDFMEYAKPGDIKSKCLPNALFTFEEYLSDYASSNTKRIGRQLIKDAISTLPDSLQDRSTKMLQSIREGTRDVFV